MAQKKQSKKSWLQVVIVIAVILLVAAFSLSIVTHGFRDWSKLKSNSNDKQTDKLPDEGGEKKDGGETSKLELLSAEGEIYVIS